MKPEQNLDQHLFSEEEGNHYSPKCFMTKDRKLGIDVGGKVITQSLKEWGDALIEKELHTPKMNKVPIPQWPAFLVSHSDGKVKIDPCYSDSASTYKLSITTKYKGQLFADVSFGDTPEEALLESYNTIRISIECKKFEDDLADKGILYQCGTDHPVSGIKPKEYCDQCGNTGFSLFDGKKCVHTKYGLNMDRGIKPTKEPRGCECEKPLILNGKNRICDKCGYKVPYSLTGDKKEDTNVHINKGLDVNIQDQPILKQIEHHQRQIQDSWHKINKLIRESEEK